MLSRGRDVTPYEKDTAMPETDYEAVLIEVFRKALLKAHADDWDMETCAEAAHVCAAAMMRQFDAERTERRRKLTEMMADDA